MYNLFNLVFRKYVYFTLIKKNSVLKCLEKDILFSFTKNEQLSLKNFEHLIF